MKTALVVMAAGIGSRFGGGIKQLAPVGPNGEIIMDYSIHDALEAGFNKVVFIIRRDIEKDFREVIGNRFEELAKKLNVEIAYAYQDLNDVPASAPSYEGRTKPWGTGQAILACRDVVNEPFAVINADDYYGKEAFRQLHSFMISNLSPNSFAMAGFILKNTLSDNGGVTRGVCKVDENSFLTEVVETSNIVKDGDGALADGVKIDPEAFVSMNCWAFTPSFIGMLEKGFVEFFANIENPLKSEYLLPTYVGELLSKGEVTVKVLKTNDKWFGVTYKEDKESVINSFKKLIEDGVYKKDLFSDLF